MPNSRFLPYTKIIEDSALDSSGKWIRKPLRKTGYDYSQDGAYFVTVCCHAKRHLFGTIVNGEMLLNEYGLIVNQEWFKTKTLHKGIILDQFVVMPNHIHAIVIINPNYEPEKHDKMVLPQPRNQETIPKDKPELGIVIKCFKQAVTIKIRAHGFDGKVWQKGYYDHIIRNMDDYYNTIKYIVENPQNWSTDPHNEEND